MTTYYCDCMGWDGFCCGIYVSFCKDNKWSAICEIISNRPDHTNNQLEYLAVIAALEMAEDGDIIYTDSKLVEKQIKGVYEVKHPNLIPLHAKAIPLYEEKLVTLHWVPRELNEAGRDVENRREFLNETGIKK